MPIRRIRQAVLALMERDAELAAKTGQPIRADPQRARPIIATSRARSRRGRALAATAMLVGAEGVRHESRSLAAFIRLRQDGTKSPGCRGNCHHDMSAMNKCLAQMSIATCSSFAIEAPPKSGVSEAAAFEPT